MSVLFNHAIRYEWLEQGRNPITFVRQSAQRKNAPAVLEAAEIQSLLAELVQPFRLMVLLDVTTGLRRSELFALKWSDIDWNLVIEVRRSICEGVVGKCKTEASRRSIPLSLDVAADLWLWKEQTNYATPDDWVFASPRLKGKVPDGRTSCWGRLSSLQPCVLESRKGLVGTHFGIRIQRHSSRMERM
jgi:integrase